MQTKKCYTILVLILLWAAAAYSQENRSEILLDFRVNSTRIDLSYGYNAERLQEINDILQDVLNDTTVNILSLSFCGTASPEGSYQFNKRLAQGRLDALEKMVRSKVALPDSLVTRDCEYIPWNYLAKMVEASDLNHKEEVLEILNSESEIVDYYGDKRIDRRIFKLQKLDGGKVWREMLHRFFGSMRNAGMVIVTFRHLPPPAAAAEVIAEEDKALIDTVVAAEPAPIAVDTVPEPAPVVEEWGHKLYVKTNALGWGLAIANAAVEMDLCRHWSFNLPVYYSAWDYFKSTVKFRTLAFYPEIRYWFSGKNLCNEGCFIGAHFGLVWYNVATDGKYRTQDHGGHSPALGGGLAVGYRLPISSDKRWKMEFSVGAGVYRLHYDKFRNCPDGLLVSTEKKTRFVLDQAAVSFAYTFDLKRKGGKR